jgi:hypothetical protein
MSVDAHAREYEVPRYRVDAPQTEPLVWARRLVCPLAEFQWSIRLRTSARPRY